MIWKRSPGSLLNPNLHKNDFFMLGGGSCSFAGHFFLVRMLFTRFQSWQCLQHRLVVEVCNTALLLKVGLKRDLGPRGSFQENFPQIVSSSIRRWISSLLEEWKTFWENTFRGAAWRPWWRSGRHQARGRNCQWNLESFAEKPLISKKVWIPCTAVMFWNFHTDPLIRTNKKNWWQLVVGSAALGTKVWVCLVD